MPCEGAGLELLVSSCCCLRVTKLICRGRHRWENPDDAGPWFLPQSTSSREYIRVHTFTSTPKPFRKPAHLALWAELSLGILIFLWNISLGNPAIILETLKLLCILNFLFSSFCHLLSTHFVPFIQVWRCRVLALLDFPLLSDYL